MESRARFPDGSVSIGSAVPPVERTNGPTLASVPGFAFWVQLPLEPLLMPHLEAERSKGLRWVDSLGIAHQNYC